MNILYSVIIYFNIKFILRYFIILLIMSDRVAKMIVAIKQEAADRANEIAEITK